MNKVLRSNQKEILRIKMLQESISKEILKYTISEKIEIDFINKNQDVSKKIMEYL